MVTRIYLGICLSVALAALLSVTFYSTTRSERLANYQLDALSGVMTLISDASQLQAPESRMQYLEIVSQLIGAEIDRIDTAESARLRGESAPSDSPFLMVNREDEISWLLPYSQSEDIVMRLPSLGEQQFRGHALLVVSELSRAGQRRGLSDLQHYSAYDMQLAALSDTELDAQQRSRLSRNSVVVDYNTNSGNQFSVFAPLGQDEVLVVGPIPQFDELPFYIVLSMISLSLLIVVAIASWLVRRLDKRLGHLATALEAFTEGDLKARVHMASGDQIYQLGLQINAMAVQIEDLLRNQQDVMQAVSHDLRTPLSRIRFRLESIQNNAAQGVNVQSKIDGIRNDITELEGLIDQVLEHQRLVRVPELVKQEFDLVATVRSVGERLQETFPEKRISASYPKQLAMVAHESSIDRLLQNLVSNACKHANSRVQISVRRREEKVTIVVEDDGPGIPESEREKVFETFYRVDDSRNSETGGYGLGLAICRRILQLHGAIAGVSVSDLGGALIRCEFTQATERQEVDSDSHA